MPATTEATSRGTDGPTSWRAGLRKAGSSSAVPETAVSSAATSSNDSDKLARSASSSWLASDKVNYMERGLGGRGEGVGERWRGG